MARPIDTQRQKARRMHIIDAALTTFAQHGYHGASTAKICDQAGISSGTFFHYFPTKLDVLLAILKLGIDETRKFGAALENATDPLAAINCFISRTVSEAGDWRLPGFAQCVAGVMTIPEIADAVAEDEQLQRDLLIHWVARGISAGQFRSDLTAERITSWLLLFTNGFIDRVAMDSSFNTDQETQLLLHDTVQRFICN